MKPESDILRQFGLTEKEIEAYLLLLELGPATSGELMKKLGYYSKTIYELLEKLMGKGLVSYVIQSNRKHFEAAQPEKLLDILKERESNIKTLTTELKAILPKLNEKRILAKDRQEAAIYKGPKGIKSILDETLKQKKEILVLGSGGRFKETLPVYYENWKRRRIKQKIPIKVLWNEKHQSKISEFFDEKFMDIRILPAVFDNPSPTIVYDDCVAILVWGAAPLGIVIRSRETAKSYQHYFEVLWRVAKKI